MNKLLKELHDWLDEPKQLNRQMIKDKIIEIDTKNKPKRKTTVSKIFTPPTVEEIKEYCLLRDNKIDAEHFYDFYQSKGWMIGKNKMKDFKAAVRTWEKLNNTKQNNDGTRQQPLLGRQSADTVRANASGWNNA